MIESWNQFQETLKRLTSNGHALKRDNPDTLSFNFCRFTCARCHKEVLRYEGNVYGSVLDGDCLKPEVS